MTTDHQLLADYAGNGSEQAFQELVSRYINLVYSTAARLMDGDAHLAEDVAQTVFADLARQAGALSKDVMLGGWLHRRACHVAATLMRSIRRRHNRERQAAEMNDQPSNSTFHEIAPVLDEAIDQLKSEDREAIMLRFFANRDLRFIGEALGSNEDAAQKRIARALEKLRIVLARRGVSTSTAVLAGILGSQAVTAAPVGLAAVIGGTALAKAATGGGTALTLIQIMALSKTQIALGAIVAAGLGTTLLLEHQALRNLRLENDALRQQIAGISRRHTPSPEAPAASGAGTSAEEEANAIRAKIEDLRGQTTDLAKLRDTNSRLRSVVAQSNAPSVLDTPEEAEFKEQTQMRVQHMKQWGLSFRIYANKNGNRFPKSFEEAAHIQNTESLLEFDTNHFEIAESFDGLTRGDAIVFKEKEARPSPKGGFVKVYGMADGSVQTVEKPSEADLVEYEKQHEAK